MVFLFFVCFFWPRSTCFLAHLLSDLSSLDSRTDGTGRRAGKTAFTPWVSFDISKIVGYVWGGWQEEPGRCCAFYFFSVFFPVLCHSRLYARRAVWVDVHKTRMDMDGQ